MAARRPAASRHRHRIFAGIAMIVVTGDSSLAASPAGKPASPQSESVAAPTPSGMPSKILSVN
jgi:hypothetical protein